jgi:chromosome segregation ATPase
LQAETLRLESEKLSEMSGDDSEELNELLKVKIRELAEASAIAATADSLQKELNEKVKEAIDLQTRFNAAEAAQKEQSRELEDLRAKLRDLHSEALAQPPLVRDIAHMLNVARIGTSANRALRLCCTDGSGREGSGHVAGRGGEAPASAVARSASEVRGARQAVARDNWPPMAPRCSGRGLSYVEALREVQRVQR